MSEEIEIRCPKCGYQSGDDWSQCEQSCPMRMSPWFDPLTEFAFEDKDFDNFI